MWGAGASHPLDLDGPEAMTFLLYLGHVADHTARPLTLGATEQLRSLGRALQKEGSPLSPLSTGEVR